MSGFWRWRRSTRIVSWHMTDVKLHEIKWDFVAKHGDLKVLIQTHYDVDHVRPKRWFSAFLSAYAMKFLAVGVRDEGRSIKRDTLPTLKRFMDLIPMPRLRKRVLKLLADQVAHIVGLREQHRSHAARWIEFTTWVLAVWYIFTAPVTALWNFAFGRARGAGD